MYFKNEKRLICIGQADIGTVKPQAEPSEGRVEGEGSKKKVTRKVSIPILDLEIEKSEKNKEDEAGKGKCQQFLFLKGHIRAKEIITLYKKNLFCSFYEE